MGKARTFSDRDDDDVYRTETENENYSLAQQNAQNLGSTHFSDQSGYGNFSQSGRDQRNASLDGALFRGNIGFELQIATLDVSTNTLDLSKQDLSTSLSKVSVDHIVALSSGITGTLITILGAQRPGQRVALYGIFGNTITIQHTATATDDTILCPNNVDFTLADNAVVELVYDITTAKWRIVGVASDGGGGNVTFPILYPKEDLTPLAGGTATIDVSQNTGNAKQIQFPSGDISLEITGDPASNVGEVISVMFIQDVSGGRSLTSVDTSIKNGSAMDGLLDKGANAKTIFEFITLDGGVSYHYDLISPQTTVFAGNLSDLNIDVTKDWQAFGITNLGPLSMVGDIDLTTQDIRNVDRLQLVFDSGSVTSASDVVWYVDSSGDLISNVNVGDGWGWSVNNSLKASFIGGVFEIEDNNSTSFSRIVNKISPVTVGDIGAFELSGLNDTPTQLTMAFFSGNVVKIADGGSGSAALGVAVDGAQINFIELNSSNDEQVNILKDLDLNTFDILNIDRAIFATSDGIVTANDVTQILLNINNQFQFNTENINDFVFSFSNNAGVVFDHDTVTPSRNLSVLSDSTDTNSISQINLTRSFEPSVSLQTIGLIGFRAPDDTNSGTLEYASIEGKIEDATAGSIDGSLNFTTTVNNSVTSFMILNNTSTAPDGPDTIQIRKDITFPLATEIDIGTSTTPLDNLNVEQVRFRPGTVVANIPMITSNAGGDLILNVESGDDILFENSGTPIVTLEALISTFEPDNYFLKFSDSTSNFATIKKISSSELEFTSIDGYLYNTSSAILPKSVYRNNNSTSPLLAHQFLIEALDSTLGSFVEYGNAKIRIVDPILASAAGRWEFAVVEAGVEDVEYLRLDGQTTQVDIFKPLSMNTNKITSVVDPTADQDAATKKYVDDNAGTGDVVGPVSSTDNAIVRFDGITGKLIQNSLITILDSGTMNFGNESISNLDALGFNDIGGTISVADDAAGFNFVTTSDRPFRFTPNSTNVLDIDDGGLTFIGTKILDMAGNTIDNVGLIEFSEAGQQITDNTNGMRFILPDAGDTYDFTIDGTLHLSLTDFFANWATTVQEYTQRADPASPAANDVFFYAKLDGGFAKLFYKQSDGTVVGPLGAGGAVAFPIRPPVTTGLPTTGTVTLNLNQESGHYFDIGTLTGNIDISITNPPSSGTAQAFRINIVKGASNFTVTFNDTLLVTPIIGGANTTTLLAGDIYDGSVFNIFTMTSTAGSGGGGALTEPIELGFNEVTTETPPTKTIIAGDVFNPSHIVLDQDIEIQLDVSATLDKYKSIFVIFDTSGGGFTVTWPASVVNPPIIDDSIAQRISVILYTINNGTLWTHATSVGSSGGVSFPIIPPVSVRGTVTTTQDIDLSLSVAHSTTMTLGASISITFSNFPTTSNQIEWEVQITQDGTGGHIVTWPANVVNPPVLDTTAGSIAVVSLRTNDGGATVRVGNTVTTTGGGGGEFLGPWTANHNAGNFTLEDLNSIEFTQSGGQIIGASTTPQMNFSLNSGIFRFTLTGSPEDILDIDTNGLTMLDGNDINLNDGELQNIDFLRGNLDGSVQHIQPFGTTTGIAGDSSWAVNIGQTGFFQISDAIGIKFRVAGATGGNNSLTEVVDLSVEGTGAGAGLTLATGASIVEFSTDGTLAGDSDTVVPTEQAVRTFVEAQAGGGDVVGPASATNNAVARFDTTTGKLIQNSLITISDTAEIENIDFLRGNLDGSVQHIQPFGTTTGIAGDSSWAINIGQTGHFQVSDSNGIKFRVAGATAGNNSLTEVVALSIADTTLMTEITLPSNPAANNGLIYLRDVAGTTTPFFLDSAGTESSMIGAGAAGANTALSNLTSPTAINQTFQLNTDNLFSLGTPTVRWRDLNINTIDIQDSAVTFNPTTGATQIRADSGGMNLGVAFASDFFDFFFGGTAEIRLEEDRIQFVDGSRAHRIVSTNSAFQILSDASADAIELTTGTSRTNPTIDIEDERTTWRTTTSAISAVLLQLIQNNNTPANFRTLANIDFIAENSVSVDTLYARVSASSQNVTDGSERGLLQLGVAPGGGTQLVASIDMEGDGGTGSLIGFFGVTPVAQQSPAANSAAIIAALENLGLFV